MLATVHNALQPRQCLDRGHANDIMAIRTSSVWLNQKPGISGHHLGGHTDLPSSAPFWPGLTTDRLVLGLGF